MQLEIKRYAKNPILGPDENLEWAGNESRNPGVVFDGNKFHMIFTTMPKIFNGELYLGYAESSDGVNFVKRAEPFMRPSENPDDFDHASVEDCRITAMDGKFYIAYAGRYENMKKFAEGERHKGPDNNINPTYVENFRRVGFAETCDFKTFKRLGPLTNEHISDANVALFPEKINGRYALLHRPTAFLPWTTPCFYHPGCIWLAYTDALDRPLSSSKREMPWDMEDLKDLPDDRLLIAPEQKWEEMKIGGSGVPIPTDDGFLTFYHGVDRGGKYRVGLMLLNRENPAEVIARSPYPIMEPETNELEGFYRGGCIFPCANVVVGENINLYYGIGDKYCGVAFLKLKSALDYINQYRKR